MTHTLTTVPAGIARLLRRGIIAGFAVAFAIPYFRVLNTVHAHGDELLRELPTTNVIFLANHQTYFLEAIAFLDLIYLRHRFPLERPVVRVSAAEETMRRNPLTLLMRLAGVVTLRRRHREGERDVRREVDLEGVARIHDALRTGWLLHFPAGTTREGARVRPGVARILHDTRAVAVPVRVDGFRRLLLAGQMPGRVFQECSIRLSAPLELQEFYDRPLSTGASAAVLARIEHAIAS